MVRMHSSLQLPSGFIPLQPSCMSIGGQLLIGLDAVLYLTPRHTIILVQVTCLQGNQLHCEQVWCSISLRHGGRCGSQACNQQKQLHVCWRVCLT